MRALSLISALAFASAFSTLALPAHGQVSKMAQQMNTRIKVTTVDAEKRVDITIDNKPFATYTWGPAVKRPSLTSIYSPKGNLLTRSYPLTARQGDRVDRPEQTGLWFGYGNVNGIDFWNQPDKDHAGPFGTIRHKAVKRAVGGSSNGTLVVESEWVGPDGKVLITEIDTMRFNGMGSDRTIDRITTLTATPDHDVMFVDNEDGLLGLRLCRFLEHTYKEPIILAGADGKPAAAAVADYTGVSGEYVNGESQRGDSAYGKRSEFLLVNGLVQGEPVSVVMLDHPNNLGHPTYWNARGYGLMAANPLGQGVYSKGVEELNAKLHKGKSLTFRHRIVIQSGRQLTEADCERKFKIYSEPDEE